MSSIRDMWLLFKKITKDARKEINASLEGLGLNSSEAGLLLHLGAQKGEMTQEQLADSLDITKAAISRAADSLARKGYLLRRKGEQDKRYSWLSLTTKAEQVMDEVVAAFDCVYAMALAGISDAETEIVVAILERVSRNLETKPDKRIVSHAWMQDIPSTPNQRK